MRRKPLKKGEQCSPLRYRSQCRPRFGKRNGQAHSLHGAGKAFAPNQHNFTGCETLWFVPLSRYRAGAKNVYVHSQSATEKTTPQSASLTAPLTQGSQWEVRRKICSAQKECEIIRFVPFIRYRASAINVWVQPQSASEKCLPLEGKVSAKPTDEVKFNPCANGAHLNYSLFIRRHSHRPTDEVLLSNDKRRSVNSLLKNGKAAG